MSFFSDLWNTYQQGLEYPKLVESYQDLVKTLDTERKQFTSVITELENENILLYNDLEECSLNLAETHTVALESTFSLDRCLANLKRKTAGNVFKYPYKGDGKDRDIREVLKPKFVTLVELYGNKAIDRYQPKTPTECVEAVIKYFLFDKVPKYVSDDKKWNKRDYWETADVFLSTWEGDCDAVSNAQHNIIKYVLEKKGFAEHYDRLYWHIHDNLFEGHANNLWLHEDGYFYTIESTIDPKGTFNKKWLKTPLANDSFYTKTRCIVNNSYNTMGNGEVDSNFL